MDALDAFLVFVTAAAGLVYLLRRRRGAPPGEAPRADTPTPSGEAGAVQHVRDDASLLREAHGWALPSVDALLADAVFSEALSRLQAAEPSTALLVRLARDGDPWVSRLALAALVSDPRHELPEGWASTVVRRLEPAPYDQAGLMLQSLARVPGEVIGPVLCKLEDVRAEDLAALVRARVEGGVEQVDAELLLRHVPRRLAGQVADLVADEDVPESVREAVAEWRESFTEIGAAEQYGQVWQRPFDDPPTMLAGRRVELVEEILEAVTGEPARSVLLVGEHGVGKTALVRAALDRLDPSWSVFELTASSLNAGASWVGELERRVEELVAGVRGKRAVWVFPELHESLHAGAHTHSPRGLIDHILPHVESGAVRIVGEVSSSAYELLIANRPRVESAFRAVRVRPLGASDAIAVARHALDHDEVDVAASDEVLAESLELAEQFLPGAAPPGNLLVLLRAVVAEAAESGRRTIDVRDVLTTLASLSGLPLALLDASRPLDLDAVRAYFGERVLGQPEAVSAIVDRIALVKAGLTDPTRPLGVFLFVGPTGTGKTEIAKTLAEFVFGSPSRLIRLDMSEYQTPDSFERLLADTTLDGMGAPLIAGVRRDPFAVVLLDEFEKAAQPIWDLFLQVFDDGRLTDRHGRTTDFRRTIIILTSNVGSSLAGGAGLGFERGAEPFRPEQVARTLQRHFRAEFLNRIDRVVVFLPFERSQMRALLEKELADVLARRGLRDRPWAVEIDETAIAFLVEQGFTPDLGARPLKRAVEQHLLAPLARSIVGGRVPHGDQFLFITALDGRIDVRFVGLEQGPGEAPAGRALEEDEGRLTVPESGDALRTLLRHDPNADGAGLPAFVDRVEGRVDGDLAERKHGLLEEMSGEGFWERDDRFGVLAEIEYLDRLEAATDTARRLAERLGQATDDATRAEVADLLANRLYVLDRAIAGIDEGAPYDVYLRLRLHAYPDAGDEADGRFLGQLIDMYRAWAARRGMTVRELHESETELIAGVEGLGAAFILSLESGLHVLELPGAADDEADPGRIAVTVQVVPQPPGPGCDAAERLSRARRQLDGAPPPAGVVRRYRLAPSPLVRDRARHYRTGRVDRILAGDFDLY